MTIVVAMAIFTLALHAGATVFALSIARAPGWERVRIVVVLAATAGLYSFADLLGGLNAHATEGFSLATTINLSVAAAHASTWIWYTFADERGSWRSIPRPLRLLAVVNVAIALAISLTGHAVEPGVLDRVTVPLFGIDYLQPRLSLAASMSAVLILATLIVSFVEFVRRARRRVPGAGAVAAGFAVFVLCSLEEGLVSIGALDFLYLAEVGYLALIVPVTARLVQRFVADAGRLTLLSERLADEVVRTTTERDAARDALARQERMAALGRIASGIGHEINNPLQFLLLSLEELDEETTGARTATADAALRHALEGTDRIRRVVEGLRSYSAPARDTFEPLDLTQVVQAALRVASPQLRGAALVRPLLGPVPPVLGDEGKMVQVVVNAIVNAALALKSRPPLEPATIRIISRTTRDGDAELEVRDNGPGFPVELLPKLGEPFVTTRVAEGGSGLGIFVIRGILSAHGGTLALENAPEGGAVLRLRLPAARAGQGTTAVASISTTAPGSISAETSTAVIAG